MAKTFRDIGYQHAKTTRQASRLLDDCKIDIAFTPYNIQCKSVLANINYTTIFKEMKKSLIDNFPKDDSIHDKPLIICHKRGRTSEEHHVVLKFNDFINLISKIKEYEIINDK